MFVCNLLTNLPFEKHVLGIAKISQPAIQGCILFISVYLGRGSIKHEDYKGETFRDESNGSWILSLKEVKRGKF